MDQASQILTMTDLTVLSGDDSLTLPLMALNGEGVISVVGNIIPQDMNQLVQTALNDDLQGARAMHSRLFPLCRDMLSLATNPIPIKCAMQMLGLDSGELRLPMTELEEDAKARLRRTLTAYGLL